VFSPGTQEHDANPTGLLASGGSIFVADSGANLINRVSTNGKIRIVHYFRSAARIPPTSRVMKCPLALRPARMGCG
jgi:hypothetical protein